MKKTPGVKSLRGLLHVLFKTTILSCLFCFAYPSLAQQWNTLGNETQISSVASSYTTITVLNNVPYVAYVEGSSSGGIAKVKRKNYSTDTWEQVGNTIAANATYTRIYSDKNNQLYVTYADAANGNKLAVVTYNNTTQTWDPLSAGNLYVSTGTVTYTVNGFNGTPRNGLAFDSNNVPYITFSERSAGNNKPYVKRFAGNIWETVGADAVSTDSAIGNNIAIDDNNTPYVVYVKQATATASSGSVKMFRFNSGTGGWEDVSPPSPVSPGSSSTGATTAVRHTSISMDSTYNPIVSYFNTSNSNRSTIIRYNKTTATWNFIGTTSTRDAPLNSLVNDGGGNVYNMFADALINGGLSTMVRVFKLYRGAAGFSELKNPTLIRGIDSTGDNSTTARSISISDLSLAVGTDTAKPFIVYTKTNAANIRTPIVQVFTQPVLTSPVTNISAHSAVTGGDVSDVSGTINERGIVYSTTANPTTSNNKIIDSSGNSVYTITITGLIPATSYFARAYAITDSGTVYGNNVSFTTPAPDSTSVTVADYGSSVVLSNGIVKATIVKSSATVTSLIYNGVELISGGFNGGQLYWSWNMPNYQNPSGCTYTLTVDPHSNSFNYAEIKLHMRWDGTSSTAAMDVDVYYSLPKGAQGVYASATLSHPATYPALPGGEWRMAGYPNPRFDWLSVDSLRNRLMPSGYDLDNSLPVDGAPKEVTLLTTGIYKNNYECKYDYSADFGAIDAWGWSSTTDNVGLWITAPSKEYYPGGPMKRELMCHATPVILNMLGGTHYGMGDNGSVAAGEDWQKTFGPFLIYCNKVAPGTADAPHALWNDAINKAKAEQAAWPYSWYTNPNYVQESGRGTVTGKLVINSIGASAANMWVGLAKMPLGSTNVTDFQRWNKNYQFWVKTDASGNFSIPHVLPGTYNLYAFGAGAAGQLTRTDYATVTAGGTTNLDTVLWTPNRIAPTVWEIGVPDRNAAEFKHGSDWWTSNIFPNTHWAKFMDYVDEFPNGVNYTIGQSDPATDWNFVMPYDKSAQSTSPKWTVNFKLPLAPKSGTNASVYVALAASFSAALILNVNDSNITSPVTGVTFGDNSDAMIRKGIHGAFTDARFTFPASLLKAGDNHIAFTIRITGGGTSGDVMFDYLRLEADIPPCTAVLTAPVSQSFCYTGNNYQVPALTATANCGIAGITYNITGATTRSRTGADASGMFNVGVSNIIWAVTDSAGNTSTDSTIVTIHPPLTAGIPDVYAIDSVATNKNTVYLGYGTSSLTINATPNGPYTWLWNTGQTTASISVNAAGTYSVAITDTNGCIASASIAIKSIDVSCGIRDHNVLICHHGHTLCISPRAVQAHLDHGDKLGECTNDDDPGTSHPDVSVYPNPTNGQLAVLLKNYRALKATVMIMTLTGNIIAEKEVSLLEGAQTVEFNIAGHPQGIYFVKVLSTDGMRVEKIVLRK